MIESIRHQLSAEGLSPIVQTPKARDFLSSYALSQILVTIKDFESPSPRATPPINFSRISPTASRTALHKMVNQKSLLACLAQAQATIGHKSSKVDRMESEPGQSFSSSISRTYPSKADILFCHILQVPFGLLQYLLLIIHKQRPSRKSVSFRLILTKTTWNSRFGGFLKA